MISITKSAAEKITEAVNQQDIEGKSLRVGVFPGGCSGGYQYALGFDEERDNDSSFESKGLKVNRINWDDPNYNWSDTAYALFRTTWDYFDRFSEFSIWLKEVSQKTKLINPMNTILWNLDKHYLQDLKSWGLPIPESFFVNKN